MRSNWKPLISGGICLILGGSIIGVVMHQFGFPWGAVIMISSGVYCLFEGFKLWLRR